MVSGAETDIIFQENVEQRASVSELPSTHAQLCQAPYGGYELSVSVIGCERSAV